MKVIDCGASDQKEAKPRPGVLDRIGIIRRKLSPADILIQALSNVLDNRFVMMCEVCLEDQADVFPLILLGPTGVWLILPSAAKGVYKVSEEVWEELDERTHRYKPVKFHPMTAVNEKSKRLINHLEQKGIDPPPIEKVIFFSNPGAHADTNRPAARIVLSDGLSRFITSILTARIVQDGEAIQGIVDALVCKREPEPAPEDLVDAYSLRDLPAPKKPREPTQLELMSREEPQIVGRLSKRLPFNRWQWFLIAILIVVNIIILLLLVWVVIALT